MNRFFRLRPVLFVFALAVAAFVLFGGGSNEASAGRPPFETAEIQIGSIESTVSATGTLGAVGTVEVGTQVSGTVERVFVDDNDHVEAGQLLAILDTDLLDAATRDASAGVSRARAGVGQAESAVAQAQARRVQADAQLDQARARLAEVQATLARSEPLAEQGYLSAREFVPIQTAVATAEGDVRSAQSAVASAQAGVASARAGVAASVGAVASATEALRRARKNRQNAEIRAPIAGVVVQRAVEAGQTVAASFSTPTLFVIAESLREMEILVQVDESDVGQIRPGQDVRFTVTAYPNETFRGVALEVRLKPETIQNVVLYTAVVSAENPDDLLLPGMTATADFVVAGLEDALLAPSASIRFEPPEPIRAAARAVQRAERADADLEAATFSADLAEIWTPTADGGLRPVLVRVLATDGAQVAIAPADAADRDTVRVGLAVATRTNEPTDR